MRLRPPLLRAAAAALIFVGTAAVLEGAARLAGAELPEWRSTGAGEGVMGAHPTRLWALSPGARANAGAIATINTLGLRGDPPVTPKPEGRLRVLVLGDSTFFGHGVADGATFPAQLQARLVGEGLDVEVLNGAVPGYSTEQTRIELDELGWALAPDLLVLGNLWSDNNVDSFRDADLLATARMRRENPLFESHAFRLLVRGIHALRGGESARFVTWTQGSRWPETGGRRVPLRRYAENLDAMVREAAARGIGAALMAPSNVGMTRGKYAPGASWDPYFDAQRRVAAHHGIPLIETLPALRAAAGDAPRALYVDAMHPSAKGHAALAEAADTTLRAAGWPEARLLAAGGVFAADILVDGHADDVETTADSPQRSLFDVPADAAERGSAHPSRNPRNPGFGAP